MFREVTKHCIDRYPGWPKQIVGGGQMHWRAGAPTDDSEMAMAILRSVKENNGKLVPEDVLSHFLKWFATSPKDVGNIRIVVKVFT